MDLRSCQSGFEKHILGKLQMMNDLLLDLKYHKKSQSSDPIHVFRKQDTKTDIEQFNFNKIKVIVSNTIVLFVVLLSNGGLFMI